VRLNWDLIWIGSAREECTSQSASVDVELSIAAAGGTRRDLHAAESHIHFSGVTCVGRRVAAGVRAHLLYYRAR
jgi:hypothetical protein